MRTQPIKDKRVLAKGLLFMAVVMLLIGSAMYVPAALTVSKTIQSKDLPIYCVQTDKKQIALSFDAAWGNEDTAEILEILKKHNLKVTFFMTGGWVEKYPDDVKAICAAGHDLGNHSETHPNMSGLGKEQMALEIQAVHEKVKELTGVEMDLFRPPYGDYNDSVVKTVRECGYYCIQWDVDSLDWKDYGVESIIKTVCNSPNLNNGSIILMHNGGTYTAQSLEAIITGLQAQGYEIIPISQLILRENYSIDHTGKQIPR